MTFTLTENMNNYFKTLLMLLAFFLPCGTLDGPDVGHLLSSHAE